MAKWMVEVNGTIEVEADDEKEAIAAAVEKINEPFFGNYILDPLGGKMTQESMAAAWTLGCSPLIMTYGDLVQKSPRIAVLIEPHEWDNMNISEQRNWLGQEADSALKELAELRALLNTPEIEDFDKGVPLESAHQIQRWGAAHDAGKQPEDWFWLCGYLAGKALSSFKAGDAEKAKHHCISTAAAMRNWHKAIATGQSTMQETEEDNDDEGSGEESQ